MGANGGGKEQNGYGYQGFNSCITEAEPENDPEKYAAATEGHALCGCLKPVIGIRQPDDTNATQQVEKDADGDENKTDHVIH
jgi:hypothetical protein